MQYILYYGLAILACYGKTAFSKPTTYDQRQTGDLNVQIHLKDVQVIALVDSELLEDYADYDYSYDYSDFTIKPIVKPTSSPIPTSSVKPWNTWPTNPPTTSTTPDNLWSIEIDSSTSKNTNEPTVTTNSPSLDSQENANSTANLSDSTPASNESTIKLRINDKSGNELFNDATIEKSAENEENFTATTETSSKKKCRAGYKINNKGRCQSIHSRRRFSLVPLTMQLGSKLNQKGRFTVRKDLPIRVYKSEEQK